MALPVGGKVLLDPNVLIDFLRAGMHTEWVLGGHGTVVRFISAVALLELRLGAVTPDIRVLQSHSLPLRPREASTHRHFVHAQVLGNLS
jgi:predicted nucleic acid-binding protein